jgi:hypothetical protein
MASGIGEIERRLWSVADQLLSAPEVRAVTYTRLDHSSRMHSTVMSSC